MNIHKNKRGFYVATFKTASGKLKTVSTKCTDEKEARRVVKESGLKDLEMAAKAGRLTREAIGHIVTGRKLTIEKAANEFFGLMQLRGKAPRHVANIRTTLESWMKDMGTAKLPPSSISEEHIAPWINNPSEDTAAGTRTVKLSHLRSFFDTLAIKGWTIGNPARFIRVSYDILSHEQKEPTQRKIFTSKEIERIVQDCHERGDIFWEFATRLSNLVALRLADIACLEWASFTDGNIIVWTGKRDRRVVVPLGHELDELLAQIPCENPQHLFPEQRKVATDVDVRHRLSMQFKRICERLGIEGKSFHSLRHTCITRWDREGKSLESIGKAVGHARQETTKGYIHSD